MTTYRVNQASIDKGILETLRIDNIIIIETSVSGKILKITMAPKPKNIGGFIDWNLNQYREIKIDKRIKGFCLKECKK